MTITMSSVLTESSSGASLRPPHRLSGHPGCGRWLTEITRTERRRTDMRQPGTALCRRSLGAGTERRDRCCVAKPVVPDASTRQAPPRSPQEAAGLCRARDTAHGMTSCPLASQRRIAAASSSWRLTLRRASVHAPSKAVVVRSDASTIVMARWPMRLHAHWLD